MNSTIIEYDREKRPISMTLPGTGIKYTYLYNGEDRIVIIESEKQRSNFKTTIQQKLINFEYKDYIVFQEGDVYDIEIEYDDLGNEKTLKRTNKKKNTKYSKRTYRCNDGVPMIWTEEYNGIVNLGFKVDLNKILK